MKLLKSVTILAVAYIIVYFAGAWVLKFVGLSYGTWVSYRTWVGAFEEIIIIWILPLLGIIWTGVWLKKKSAWSRVAKCMLQVAEVAIYVCWSYVGFFIFVFSLNEEKALTPNLLATNYGVGLGSYYVCERPISLFFKVHGTLTEEDKVEYLEEKYGREFEIGDADDEAIYDKEFPEIRIRVRFSTDSGEFWDDYVQGVLADCLTEGMEELDIEREYYVSEDFRGYNYFYIHLKDEGDIPSLAEDVSKLIGYVCKRTNLFEEHWGNLYFYCGEIKSHILFGRFDRWDKADANDYLDPEKLEELIGENYKEALDSQRKKEEYEREQEELLKSQISQEAEEEYIDPIETSAKIIYNAVLAEQEYSYEVCHNAKGNLYINLGSRPAGEAGDQFNTGMYCFTLVYDRTSKNGACELFVLYKEHYAEEDGMGQSDATAILNMYAVEVDTGKVVAANKQSWSDVGTREYRELTGE